ncbi:hypothetical protein [Erysipelothrix tonsillarum]
MINLHLNPLYQAQLKFGYPSNKDITLTHHKYIKKTTQSVVNELKFGGA